MTEGPKPRVVVDACVFINVLCGSTDSRERERHPHSLRVFEAIEDNSIEAVVPAIVCAEVLGAGAIRGRHLPGEDRLRRRKAALEWLTNGRFLLAELDRTMVEHAAELSLRYQLKGADAVVLATAIDLESEMLYTWDSDLLKVSSVPELRIVEPAAFNRRDDDLFSSSNG